MSLKALTVYICGICMWLFAPMSVASEASVWTVDLQGALGPAKADFIIRSITAAEAADASAFVIRIDTPGGLDASMRDVVKKILAAKLPVISYVAPGGSRAASAGTYIAFASHIAAMAPATNIGSSTPVSLSPSPGLPDMKPSPPGPEGPDNIDPNPDGQDPQDSPPSFAPDLGGDAMARKVINDAVAYLQGLAELRGRNLEWAEQTVRSGANIRASEALALNVIDVIAPNLDALLTQLDGTEVVLDDRRVTLDLQNAQVTKLVPDWQHDLLEIITDPSIAYGLLIIGIWGLILEFYSPGMIFPSVFGLICIVLGAYGLQMLPVNYAGLALILLGIIFMAVEVITPTLGVLGVAGVAAFIFGSLILMDTDVPEYQIPLSIVAGFSICAAALTMFVVGAAVKARSQAVITGRTALVGGQAEVVEDFFADARGQHGRVWAASELWHARAKIPTRAKTMANADSVENDEFKKGDSVRIQDVDGLELIVTKENS